MGKPIENKSYYSYEEYLALEEMAEHRNEFFRGEVLALAGTKKAHNRTVLNLAMKLMQHYEGHECQVYTENVKLELLPEEYYVYPDVLVTCDEKDLENDLLVKSPILLVEVLSKSTAVYDLNTKMDHYLKLPSLLYYLIISQSSHKVKVFERVSEVWTYSIVEGLEENVSLSQLGIILSLKQLYKGVKLEPFQDLL